MRAAKKVIPATGNKYPPLSPAEEAIRLALEANCESATSACSIEIILASVVEARTKAGVLTVGGRTFQERKEKRVRSTGGRKAQKRIVICEEGGSHPSPPCSGYCKPGVHRPCEEGRRATAQRVVPRRFDPR